MDDNGMNQRNEDIVSDKGKIMIINLMLQYGKGLLKNMKSLTEAEQDFVDEVDEILKKTEINGDMRKKKYQEKLKDELYQKLQISPEAIQEAKRNQQILGQMARDSISEQEKSWKRQDEELRTQRSKSQEVNEQAAYKKELYRPELLCRAPKAESDKPSVKLVRQPKEREDCPVHSYQFAGRTYDIRKRGELFYMSTPNLRESVSEYEITISTEKLSKTIRVFGEISIDRMRDPNYNTMIFLQLLGITNLTDKELHGYIGSLEQLVRPDGTKKNEYKIAYLPEEYTAVLIWEEIEKEQARLNNRENKVIKLEESQTGKVVGGEER